MAVASPFSYNIMTREEIEKVRQDAEGIHIGTYVASGAMNVQKIEHVENLFPGSIDKLHHMITQKADKKRLISDDDLQRIINRMIPKITQNRHWFCIIKPLMLHGQVRYNDFAGAKEKIESLFPAGLPKEINAVDLQAMHTGSLRDVIDCWDFQDCPWSNETIFKAYVKMAFEFESMLLELLDK